MLRLDYDIYELISLILIPDINFDFIRMVHNTNLIQSVDRNLTCLVSKQPVDRAGGLGSIPVQGGWGWGEEGANYTCALKANLKL